MDDVSFFADGHTEADFVRCSRHYHRCDTGLKALEEADLTKSVAGRDQVTYIVQVPCADGKLDRN